MLLLGLRQINEYDLGFHLKGGQWTAQHHSVPRVDTYTYSAAGHEYVDSHWFYQLILYGLFQIGGYDLLILANAFLLLGVFLVLWARCRGAGASAGTIALLLCVSVWAMERRFMIRPEAVSWLLFAATLWVLESFSRRPHRFLWLLPLIQCLWANVEGLFVLGWIVMGIYWLDAWRMNKKPDSRLTALILLSVGADFLNPYFIKGVLYPFSFISKLQGDIYNRTVLELQSIPNFLKHQVFAQDSKVFIWAFGLYALTWVAGIAATIRKRKLHEVLLGLVFFYLAFSAVRNIPLFLIASLPGLAGAMADLAPTLEGALAWAGLTAGRKRWVPWVFGLGLALAGARIPTNAFYISDIRPERFGLGLDQDKLPVQAQQFMSQAKLDGHLLNSPDFGGWLEWAGDQKVYMDGRWEVMGDELYKRYIDMTFSENLATGGLAGEITRTGAQILVFEPRDESAWIDQLKILNEWRPVYLDGCAVIYLKKGYGDDIPDLSWDELVPSMGLTRFGDNRWAQSLGNTEPSSLGHWMDGFYRNQFFPLGLINRSYFASRYSAREARWSFDLELTRQTQGLNQPFLELLGKDCMDLGDKTGARLCFQRILALNPGDRAAQKAYYALSSF